MHAITIREPGGPDVLVWAEVADPSPGAGEVLVEVAAAGVNRADLSQREGNYPPPPGTTGVLGLECSGTVCALGPGVTEWHVGDQVCALLAGGGYAERVVVPVGQLLPIPVGVGLVEAAALPEVACTVWSNVVMLGGLNAGDVFLTHGGAGGIGSHAIQVGKALGATVAATAGSAQRVARCRELGADIAINYREVDFVEEMKKVGGVDVVLDNLGGSYLERNIRSLKVSGRLVIIGLQGGRKAEIDLGLMLVKRLSVHATTLRSRPLAEKARIVAEVADNVWPLVESGKISAVIDRVIPMQDAAAAHRALAAGEITGKVLLAS